jgi:ribonuclease P protein component
MERRYRLAASADFQRTRQQGKCWSHRLVILCALRNNLDHSRFGFAASRRIGKATVRNRARRRMREVVRLERASIVQGFDMVIIARPPIVQATYAEIALAVCGLLGRATSWAGGANTEKSVG